MDRRSFIQKAGLLTGGALMSFQALPLPRFTKNRTINGKVTDGIKGISKVVVSDGFSVVVTDAKGNYGINPNPKATHVWISTPAGYEFNTRNSVSKQYGKLDDRGEYNFEIKPLKEDDARHHFIIWADPQVKDKEDVELMMSTTVPDVKKMIAGINRSLVHGIGVGDLVWDEHGLFADYDAVLAQMGIPFFQALGNHDMDYGRGGDETSDATFKENYGPTYYSFNRGKAHYIVLDDVRYLGSERKYDGYISQEQLSWLSKDLQYVQKDALVIIALHIPVHNQVKNNAQLYQILQPFQNVHIMSGHTHYNCNVISNGIFEHNHGAVCGAWWTGPICSDGAPNGYGVYEVNGTDLKWYYKGTGLEKTNQLKVYVEELTNQKRLLVNVWNWDPEWKVEWWADGEPKGALENIKGFDPTAISLMKGDKLPKRRSFAEPSNTDHLFMAHFSPDVKTVRIVATDRFGNNYEGGV